MTRACSECAARIDPRNLVGLCGQCQRAGVRAARPDLTGLTVVEAAAVLGCTVATARYRVNQLGFRVESGKLVDPALRRAADDARLAALRSDRPDAPCFRCGSRDWCAHNPIPAGRSLPSGDYAGGAAQRALPAALSVSA